MIAPFSRHILKETYQLSSNTIPNLVYKKIPKFFLTLWYRAINVVDIIHACCHKEDKDNIAAFHNEAILWEIVNTVHQLSGKTFEMVPQTQIPEFTHRELFL